MSIIIYYDSEQEGKWFQSLSKDLIGARLVKLARRGNNPGPIDQLLRYDRPDIIVTLHGVPKLVLEKTSEVPTGHNVTQRFGRLANAMEENVMAVYFLPFDAMKHGLYSNRCKISARLFIALDKMENIHGVPALAVEWPSDKNQELIRDGSEDESLRKLVDKLAVSNFNLDSAASEISQIKAHMKWTFEKRLKEEPATAKFPNSVELIETREFVNRVKKISAGLVSKLPPHIFKRNYTVVYELGMTPEKSRREDPYVGTQFLYDYMGCRNGPNPSDKFNNLVLSVSKVPREVWETYNPNDPSRKSSLYYATADLIVLKDDVIVCESKISHDAYNRVNSGLEDYFRA